MSATVGAGVRAAIEELNTRFAWALDLHRFGDLRAVLAPDVRYSSGGVRRDGVEEVVAAFRARSGDRTTRHAGSGLALTPVDPHTVHGRGCWVTFASNTRAPVTTAPVYQVADFLDVYVEREGRWWIRERSVVPVFRDAALAPP